MYMYMYMYMYIFKGLRPPAAGPPSLDRWLVTPGWGKLAESPEHWILERRYLVAGGWRLLAGDCLLVSAGW